MSGEHTGDRHAKRIKAARGQAGEHWVETQSRTDAGRSANSIKQAQRRRRKLNFARGGEGLRQSDSKSKNNRKWVGNCRSRPNHETGQQIRKNSRRNLDNTWEQKSYLGKPNLASRRPMAAPMKLWSGHSRPRDKLLCTPTRTNARTRPRTEQKRKALAWK
jgi:hypothetical protein